MLILTFVGCIFAGYTLGTAKNDDSKLKWLARFLVILMFGLSICTLLACQEIYKNNLLYDHYNIIQKEVTTTTYKFIPNGVI